MSAGKCNACNANCCPLFASNVHAHLKPSFLAVVTAAALMSSVYEDHKDEDGFLYITYSGENTFGSSDSSSWQCVELCDS